MIPTRHQLKLPRWSFARRSKLRTSVVQQIINISDDLQSVSNDQLQELAWNLAKGINCREDCEPRLPLAYALVRESSRRVHGQAHYPVQIEAGIGLYDGGIVEMQTGEGKTLAALLPAYLYALVGCGCHVVTANDYLAQRDAEFARPVFEKLNISVGCLDESLPREDRPTEYQRDVTFGTAREFGFDFLKDRLADPDLGHSRPKIALSVFTDGPDAPDTPHTVQRGHFFALVDEADSVMIDDAQTPLLIAAEDQSSETRQAFVRWCDHHACDLQPHQHYRLNTQLRDVQLTKTGCHRLLQRCQPQWMSQFGVEEIFRQTENALSASHFFQRGRQYVVHDGEVALVDESTGRVSEGRKWQNGLHQAIEARENLEITNPTQTLARITVQSWFRKYRHLAGLTGTAQSAAAELKKVYGLAVTSIPTRLPAQRLGSPPRIFVDHASKDRAIAEETLRRIERGQAVLIGTPSVRASRRVSNVLHKFAIPHDVLNCLEHDKESAIVEKAGLSGRVTIATNMAGRGTDIHADARVLQNGGLHVIATEMHSNSRIDRQLIGRTGRQGQPGSYQFFVSLEDELLATTGHVPARVPHTADGEGELDSNWLTIFKKAQAQSESQQAQRRLDLLKREKKRHQLCRQIGLDPNLEMLDE